MTLPILKISHIEKRFSRSVRKQNGDAGKEEYAVLADVNLEVARGKVTAIIGGNGAGKTTLFNIISCLLPADGGTMLYGNAREIHLEKRRAHQLASIGIGRLFQDNHIFPKLSVMDNMLLADTDGFGERVWQVFGGKRKSKQREEERRDRALQIFKELFADDPVFENKQNDLAESLSYGQQRLLGLCRLFMGNYNLVLLDEPTAGVNPILVKKMSQIIRKMVDKKGMSVVLVEHNMPFIEGLADVCAFLNSGKVEVVGKPEEVLDNEQVRANYLGRIKVDADC